MKTYTLKDFKKIDKDHLISEDREYQLSRDKEGYIYPCRWYYTHPSWPRTKESGNFWCSMGHTSFDYSFTFEGALEVLNMILNNTWLYGQGRYLNGLSSES